MKKITKIIILLSILAIVGSTSYWLVSSAPWKIVTTGTATTTVNIQVKDRLKDGLVGYWTFDGQDTNWSTQITNDVSGQDNHGTISNIATTTGSVPGITAQALYFDGGGDGINVGDINATDGSSYLTLSLWVKFNTVVADDSLLFKQSDINNRYFLGFDSDLNDISVYVNNGSISGGATTGNIINTGVWNHFTMVFDGTQVDNASRLKLYFNGSSQSLSLTGTVPATTPNTSANLFIGSVFPVGLSPNAVIDDVRVYSRALSANEVMDLYQMVAGRMAKTNTQQTNRLKDGLVGYWTMDGQDTNWNTQTTNDVSASGNNGVITDMSTTTSPISGVIGQALSFNGSTDYVNAGTPNLGITDITECAWIYPKVISGNHVIMHYANTTDAENILIRLNSAGLLQVSDQNDNRLQSNSTFSINNWYYVCATMENPAGINNDIFKIYINGNLDNSTTVANHVAFATNALNIGAISGATQKFNGYIDEARIYNRALSASEVMDLYKMGVGI